MCSFQHEVLISAGRTRRPKYPKTQTRLVTIRDAVWNINEAETLVPAGKSHLFGSDAPRTEPPPDPGNKPPPGTSELWNTFNKETLNFLLVFHI